MGFIKWDIYVGFIQEMVQPYLLTSLSVSKCFLLSESKDEAYMIIQ